MRNDEKVADIFRRIKANGDEMKSVVDRFGEQEAALKTELDTEMVGRCLINRNWTGSKEANWDVVRVVAPAHYKDIVAYRVVSVPYTVGGKDEFGVRMETVCMSPDRLDLFDEVEDSVFESRLEEALKVLTERR